MKRRFTKYPSGYVKASAFLPLGDAEAVTHDAMTYLDQGKKVYIDYGALNDVITGYVVDSGDRGSWRRDYDTVYFTTDGGADYFGTKVNLYDYDYVDCDDFEGSLFIHVG